MRRAVALLVLATALASGACAPAQPTDVPSATSVVSMPPTSFAPSPTTASPTTASPATPTATQTPTTVVPAYPCGQADPLCQSLAVVQKTGIPFTSPVPCDPSGTTCVLNLDSFAPPDAKGLPVVVMIPGGPVPLGTRGYLWSLARLVAWKGAVVFTADYRSGPEWGGGYPQTFADVGCAIAYARDNAAPLGGDPSRVVLVAHSFGGFPGSVVSLSKHDFSVDEPACQAAAANGRPDAFVGVAAVYGFDHIGADFLAQLLGGTRDAVPAHWAATDITALAGAKSHPSPEVLLLAGTADAVAPVSTADEFAALLHAGGISVTVASVQGADHNSILTDPAALAAMTQLIGAKGQ